MEKLDSKRVLVVSFVATPPTSEGNRNRIFNLIQMIKECGFEVDYLYCDYGGQDTTQMNKYFKNNYYQVKANACKGIMSDIKNTVRSIFYENGLYKRIPVRYSADEIYDDAISQKASELHKKFHYDAVIAEYFVLSKVLTAFDDKVIKILDTHDKFAYRDRMYTEKNIIPEFYYTDYYNERKAALRADIILAIQAYEAGYFKRLTEGKSLVSVIGNVVKVGQPEVVHSNKILFVGSANKANMDAIGWFLENVWSKVKAQNREAELCFAGKCCEKLCAGNYTKLGVVDDLADVYRTARLVVNPVLIGTGLNIKSIEALAYAKPLVTTNVGAKGIKSEEAFVVCNKADDMANAILNILQDDKLAQKYSESAYRYVKRYNADNKKRLEKILNM